MSEAGQGEWRPGGGRHVLLAVHTGREDIVELARSSAARLERAGITVRVLEDEADDLGIASAGLDSVVNEIALTTRLKLGSQSSLVRLMEPTSRRIRTFSTV